MTNREMTGAAIEEQLRRDPEVRCVLIAVGVLGALDRCSPATLRTIARAAERHHYPVDALIVRERAAQGES